MGKAIGREVAERQDVFALDLLRALVEQPSVEGNAPAIATCLALIREALAPYARETEQIVVEGLPSLLMRFGDGPRERLLTLCGHIDVVPTPGEWDTPPFALTRIGDHLYGRGVVDMKGGVAAAVAAIAGLARVGRLAECSIELAITADEEVGSDRGVRALLERGAFQGRMVVCPEPTGLDIFLGNRGIVAFEITIEGRGGHAGMIHALASPVGPALRLAEAIEAMPFAARDARFSPPTPSVAITRIDAGAALTSTNVVPDRVTIVVDRRVLPGEELDVVIAGMERLVAEVVPRSYRPEVRVLKRWPPCETAADHLVSRAAAAAVQAIGLPGRFDMDLPSNDTSWFVAARLPAILLGPGDPLEAHATNEALTIEQFHDAIAVYAELALAVGTLPL